MLYPAAETLTWKDSLKYLGKFVDDVITCTDEEVADAGDALSSLEDLEWKHPRN